MKLNHDILSQITVFSKYAKYIPEKNRRETWEELCDRNKQMHLKKFPELKDDIEKIYQEYVLPKKVLPSMRSLQFAGKPIDLSPNRLFNCSYLPVDDYRAFSETMFLLLGGSGVGYSVQNNHIDKLPEINKSNKTRRYVINDAIEGWADAVKVLFRAYYEGRPVPAFDFRDIRPKGARLVTSGGKAPGPEPLKTCLFKIKTVLDRKNNGEKLTSLEVHDIMCHIADAVLSGGIRRAAMISFFDIDDDDMLTCKFGSWWEKNPQRGRANNSAVLVRYKITENKFKEIWQKVEASGSGEPGIYFTNNEDWLSNPCTSLDTTFVTPEGIRTLRELEEGDTIWSGEKWTKIVKKWKTGHKMVKKYTTNSGYFLGTDNHQVFFKDVKDEIKNLEKVDICLGPEAGQMQLEPQDILDGLVVGDGTVHKASNNKVLLHIGEKDQDYLTSEIQQLIVNPHSASKTTWEVKTTIEAGELPYTYERVVPERFFKGSVVKRIGFLRGLFSANGCVTAERVQLKQSSLKLVEQVQEMLSSLGIRSSIVTNKPTTTKHSNGTYTSKESYNLIIYNHSGLFMRTIGFLQNYKNKHVLLDKKARYEYSNIIKVEDVGFEDVYDITVDDEKHRFWSGGLMVSNCAEIALRPFGFCNLTEINGSDIIDQEDFNGRAWAASYLGTLQASYTNFHYLRDIWKKTAEKDALIGVSITGIANKHLMSLDEAQAAKVVVETNKEIAKKIGIKQAARTTCVKPAGTTSIVLGTSSGIHAWHDQYYVRNMRFGKDEAIYQHLKTHLPELIQDEFFKPTKQAVLGIPIKAPEDAITRHEETKELLERIKRFSINWVKTGHVRGDNTHNISATVSVKPDEWKDVGEWMWKNRHFYNGLSVLPYDGGTYIQAPFETCSQEKYEELSKKLHTIDLSKVTEVEDATNLSGEIACGPSGCDII